MILSPDYPNYGMFLNNGLPDEVVDLSTGTYCFVVPTNVPEVPGVYELVRECPDVHFQLDSKCMLMLSANIN